MWQELGRAVLEEEVPKQVSADGSYVQHSINYHRLMMHDLLWAQRLGELNGQPLSTEVQQCFQRASEFLYRMMDPATGEAPNYGANDGARPTFRLRQM